MKRSARSVTTLSTSASVRTGVRLRGFQARQVEINLRDCGASTHEPADRSNEQLRVRVSRSLHSYPADSVQPATGTGLRDLPRPDSAVTAERDAGSPQPRLQQ